MQRDDTSKFLLYIEPSKEEKSKKPLNDDLTKVMEFAFSKAKEGGSNYSAVNEEERFREGVMYKGTHTTECGEHSSNVDCLLENGMITNSLCVFYVRWYRKSIPMSDIFKLKQLESFYFTALMAKEKAKELILQFEAFKPFGMDPIDCAVTATIEKINSIKHSKEININMFAMLNRNRRAKDGGYEISEFAYNEYKKWCDEHIKELELVIEELKALEAEV